MTGPDRGRRRANPVLVLSLSLGGLSFAVLQSLVAPALPTIAQDLDASTGDISWVLIAFLLSASVLTPVFGRLGDLIGKRRVLLAVLGLLAAGTLLAALAPNLPVLIVARVVQGAAGAIIPLAIGIVREELPSDRISLTIGLLSAMIGVGAGVGVVAAGPLVDNLSWPWLFWAPLIVIGVAVLGTIVGVPESPARTPGRLDLPGAALLSVTLVSLLLALSRGRDWGWGGPVTITLLGVGGLALVAFIWVERRVREPLIDLHLMTSRGVWAADLISVLLGFAMFGTFLLVPTLVQLPAAPGPGFGATVSEAGLLLLPTTLMMLVFALIAGKLVARVGPRPPMLVGSLAVVVAFLLLAYAHDAVWHIVVSGALTGTGIGLAFAAIPNVLIDAVPASHTAEATSVNAIARTIGSSIGTAAIAAVISSGVDPAGIPSDRAFSAGFLVCAGVAALSAVASFFVPPARHHGDQAGASDPTHASDATARSSPRLG